MQSASVAESASLNCVVRMTSPQTSMHPPAKLMSVCVMLFDFPLLHVSCPPGHVCVPQKPAVRQSSTVQSAAYDCSHCPAPSHPGVVQESPSVSAHAAPTGWKPSDGQVFEVPSQRSAASQALAAGRHTAVLLASAGQVFDAPSQLSAGSHGPADARHTLVLFTSAGHAL